MRIIAYNRAQEGITIQKIVLMVGFSPQLCGVLERYVLASPAQNPISSNFLKLTDLHKSIITPGATVLRTIMDTLVIIDTRITCRDRRHYRKNSSNGVTKHRDVATWRTKPRRFRLYRGRTVFTVGSILKMFLF